MKMVMRMENLRRGFIVALIGVAFLFSTIETKACEADEIEYTIEQRKNNPSLFEGEAYKAANAGCAGSILIDSYYPLGISGGNYNNVHFDFGKKVAKRYVVKNATFVNCGFDILTSFNGDIVFSNCTFKGSYSGMAQIYNRSKGGTVEVKSCSFNKGKIAITHQGPTGNENSVMKISNCNFTNCIQGVSRTQLGQGTCYVNDCVAQGCNCAFYCGMYGKMRLENCTATGNCIGAFNEGYDVEGICQLDIINCSFIDNNKSVKDAAYMYYGPANLATIGGTTIINGGVNSLNGCRGGIYCKAGVIYVQNNEIMQNIIGINNEGIIIQTGGYIHSNTQIGIFQNGIYKMSQNACVNSNNCIFLAPGKTVQVTAELANKNMHIPITTTAVTDRNVGRIVLQMYAGGYAKESSNYDLLDENSVSGIQFSISGDNINGIISVSPAATGSFTGIANSGTLRSMDTQNVYISALYEVRLQKPNLPAGYTGYYKVNDKLFEQYTKQVLWNEYTNALSIDGTDGESKRMQICFLDTTKSITNIFSLWGFTLDSDFKSKDYKTIQSQLITFPGRIRIRSNVDIYPVVGYSEDVLIEYVSNVQSDSENHKEGLRADTKTDGMYYFWVNQYENEKANYVGWSLLDSEDETTEKLILYATNDGSKKPITYKDEELKNKNGKEDCVDAYKFFWWAMDSNAYHLDENKNAIIDLFAVWDMSPSIETKNVYFQRHELQKISIEDMSKTIEKNISISDREDDALLEKINPNYLENMSDIKEELLDGEGVTSTTLLVSAKDGFENETTEIVRIFCIDESSQDNTIIRMISEDYYSKPQKEGGLSEKSIWKVDDEYRKVILKVFGM